MSEIGKILEGIALPSLFHLTTETATFVGTIKDAGMEEPISTYYFRYGASQVADVYLAGPRSLPVPQILRLGQTCLPTWVRQ